MQTNKIKSREAYIEGFEESAGVYIMEKAHAAAVSLQAMRALVPKIYEKKADTILTNFCDRANTLADEHSARVKTLKELECKQTK